MGSLSRVHKAYTNKTKIITYKAKKTEKDIHCT